MAYSALRRPPPARGGLLDDERGDGEGGQVVVGAEEAHPVDRRPTRDAAPRRGGVVGDDVRPADGGERVDSGVEGDGADDVGGAGLFPIGRVGHTTSSRSTQVHRRRHRPGTGRLPRRCPGGPMRTPPPKGAYILWPLQARKSARVAGGGGGELGGVDEHRDVAGVGGVDELVDGGQPAGDVGPGGDGQQPRAWCGVEWPLTSSAREGPVRAALDEAPPATLVQGSRLAWCSTTVVTTTSSGRRRSR